MDDFTTRVMRKLALYNKPKFTILRVVVSKSANEELFKVLAHEEMDEQKYLKKIIGYSVEIEPAYDDRVAVIVYISESEAGILRSTFVV